MDESLLFKGCDIYKYTYSKSLNKEFTRDSLPLLPQNVIQSMALLNTVSDVYIVFERIAIAVRVFGTCVRIVADG